MGIRRSRLIAVTFVVSALAFGCTSLSQQSVDPALVGNPGGGSKLFPDSGNGGYQVVSNEWNLELSDDLRSLVGQVKLVVITDQPLQRFSVDARDLKVESVKVTGHDAAYLIDGNELVLTLSDPVAQGTSLTISIDYSAAPRPYSPSGVPFDMGWDLTTSPWPQLLIHGFPGADATWVPRSENLHDPARFLVTISIPHDLAATATGVLIDSVIIEDRIVSTWDTIDEVVGFSFSVSQYSFSKIDGPIPVDLAMQGGGATERFAELVPPILDFLVETYGPFPHPSLGITTTSARQFGFSYPGRVFIPVSANESFLVHELTHQWIGNHVETARIEDGWMTEGLADYTTVMWDELKGRELAGQRFVDRALGEIGSSTRRLDEVENIEDLLDSATYTRGALFYHGLRLEIGHEAFRALLRAMTESYADMPITPEALLELASDISGSPLQDFFTAWISSERIPALP